MGLCMFSTLLCGPGDVLAWSLCHYAGEIQRAPIHFEPKRQNDQAQSRTLDLKLATTAALLQCRDCACITRDQ
jgi:hypothetical protein